MDRVLALLSLLTVLGALLGLGRLLSRGRFDVMFLAMLLLGYWFVFRPAQIALGLDGPTPDVWFPEGGLALIPIVSMAALLWLGGFGVGALAADAAGQPARALFPRLELEPNPPLTLAALAAVTALGVTVAVWLIQMSGGTLGDSFRFVKAEKAIVGFYFLRQFAVVGALFSIFVLYYFIYLERWRRVATPSWATTFALACFAANVFSIYAWGHRYSIAMATMALFAGYHYFVRRMSWAAMGSAAVGFLAIFIGLRLLRDALMLPEDIVTPVEDANIWRKMAISMHGSQYDALMLAVRDLDLTTGLRWGEDFLAGFYALVPRQFWPDRPVFNPGVFFRQLYEPETQNGWPLTPIGEWLINFGWLGVAIGGAVSGYLLRGAQQVYADLWRNPWSMMMTTTAALIALPGGFTVGTPQSLLANIFPLFLLALTLRQLAPGRRAWGAAH